MNSNTFSQIIKSATEAGWAFTIKASNSDTRIRLINGEDNYLLTARSTDYSNQAIASSLSDDELKAICLNELQDLGRADMVSKFSHNRHNICRTDLKGNHDL
ncbi:hypothetical protein QUA41_31070 [Microcoleus sp. Pol11C1]|uniref:hypothetical protein n=1 Tax=unclassified Microcoleus TaxID=2642155 RepID=UPI002FD6B83F